MGSASSSSDDKKFNDIMKSLVDCLQEAADQPVGGFAVKGEPTCVSIENVQTRILEHQLRVSRAILDSSTAINRGLLERACTADPEMAAARNPPPVRSRSKSFDAVCCALEQIRCGRSSGDGSAEWLAAKSSGLIDQKIAKSVLSLAKPGYLRNRGRHGVDSPRRKELALGALDIHPAWVKYLKLVEEGFWSKAFAALFLASEYELEDIDARNKYMPNGLAEFLESLGFYKNEASGYASLIRDEGAKAARVSWGY